MSNILKTSDITSIASMPIKKGTLDFLFNELADMRKVIIQANAGNTNTAYILYGLIPTIAGTSYAFTEGYVYYNSKIFYVPAATITVSGSNIPVFKYNTTSYTTNADPVLFSDGNTYNVHEIHNATISADLTGTGFMDWGNVMYLNSEWIAASTVSGRFIDPYYRIHNGKLEFKGLMQTDSSVPATLSWFTLPLWVRVLQNSTRIVNLCVDGGVAWNSYIVFNITTAGLVQIVAEEASGAGVGSRYDLTCISGIQTY